MWTLPTYARANLEVFLEIDGLCVAATKSFLGLFLMRLGIEWSESLSLRR